jgi:hypothetical protein
VTFPEPKPGLVIRYAYLWASEADAGLEEGRKDRPCAVILIVADAENRRVVRVLPITHTPPRETDDALEIPHPTKQRLGLDDARSWVVLTEANDFVWPGPDLRPRIPGDPASIVHGYLPPSFMQVLRGRLLARRGRAVKRSE